ncbi:MAG: hypothetical protein MJY69_07645 [Bacteroidales bacterium]|nr:hypothetical protein [Bacteroidales bacterium]
MKGITKHIFQSVLVLGLLLAGEGLVWGNHFAKLTIEQNPKGTGKIYAGTTTNPPSDKYIEPILKNSGTSQGNVEFYVKAENTDGYHFSKWTFKYGEGTISVPTSKEATVTVLTGSNTGEDNSSNYTITANFAKNYYANISASKSPAEGSSNDPSVTCDSGDYGVETAGGSVDFTLTAYDPSDGWHFTGWTGDNIFFDTPNYLNTTASVAASTTEGGTAEYTATANYDEDFYTHLTTTHDGNGKANPTFTGDAYQHAATSNNGKTYTVTAGAAKDGYHFKSWTITNGTPEISNSNPVTITVQTSQTGGKSNATECEAIANYVLNEYYAKLNVIAGEHGSASFVTGNSKSTTTKGGDVTFDIVATPEVGYHLKSWEVTIGSGSFGSTTATSTTFTAKAADNYDEENAKTYTIKANFAIDQFNAKLTTAVSSKSDASSSTAKVSSNYTDWSTEKTAASATSGGDVTFHVKAEPATGFKFVGWATANNTDNPSDYVPNLGASGDYTVKSHTTQGETKEYQLFAVFKKEYSITIQANGTGNGRIVFKVVNKADPSIKYRISVPVGNTKVLKDVVPGDYTITPETKWSWSYNVSEAQDTDYDDNNMSTNEFTVTPKSTTKKHDEKEKTVTPGA